MSYKIDQLFFNNETDFLILRKLLSAVYPDKMEQFSRERIFWQYCGNPAGKVISFNAFHNGELVAHYACLPIYLKIGGKIIKGLLDINTATHPNHRGKGLFVKLAKTTFEYAKLNGYEFVLGVANENSIHGYLKYLNFYFIEKLQVKVGLGANIMPSDISNKYTVFWNKELLEWRLDSTIYSKSKNAIYGKTKFLGIRNILGIKTLMGCFDSKIIRILNTKRSLNICRPINLYIGLGANLNFTYFKVPSFIKRSPFNLIFLDLNGSLPKMNKHNIFFQLIDFDVA